MKTRAQLVEQRACNFKVMALIPKQGICHVSVCLMQKCNDACYISLSFYCINKISTVYAFQLFS